MAEAQVEKEVGQGKTEEEETEGRRIRRLGRNRRNGGDETGRMRWRRRRKGKKQVSIQAQRESSAQLAGKRAQYAQDKVETVYCLQTRIQLWELGKGPAIHHP